MLSSSQWCENVRTTSPYKSTT